MRRPNYRLERAERDRMKQVKKEEKLRRQQERKSQHISEEADQPFYRPRAVTEGDGRLVSWLRVVSRYYAGHRSRFCGSSRRNDGARMISPPKASAAAPPPIAAASPTGVGAARAIAPGSHGSTPPRSH
jgi:hypothetical protein